MQCGVGCTSNYLETGLFISGILGSECIEAKI